jgi:hypothetical protein
MQRIGNKYKNIGLEKISVVHYATESGTIELNIIFSDFSSKISQTIKILNH